MGLVKEGKTATLGKLYQSEVPLFGSRTYQMTIPGTPTGGPFGKNALVYHDEMLTTEIGQVSTQFDGPGHIGVRTSDGGFFYNGRDPLETYERGASGRVVGMGALGVEFVAEKGFVCRGVLLDAVAYKGMNPLPIPTTTDNPGIVTADDVTGMVAAQGLDPIGKGDCVLLYTGHGDLWSNAKWPAMSSEDRAAARATFTSGEPGFGVSACEYMASRKIILTGGDTSANDAQPVGEEEGFAVPCHTESQTRRGIWNIENLDFAPLPEVAGAVPWEWLADVRMAFEGIDLVPEYRPELRALDGEAVTLVGFLVPARRRRAAPAAQHGLAELCPYCLPGGPETFVELLADAPIAFTDQAAVVTGRLELLEDSLSGYFHRLHGAECVDDPAA